MLKPVGLAPLTAALGEPWKVEGSLLTTCALSQNSPPPCPNLLLVALGCADDGFNVSSSP